VTLSLVVWLTVGWAMAGVLVLGLAQLLGLQLSERFVQRGAVVHSLGLVFSSIAVLVLWLPNPVPVLVSSSPLFHVHGASWQADFMVDRLSVTCLALLSMVYPPIVRFSVPSFHREPGAQRFWFLVALFAFGLVMVMLSGNIDVFFLGWEVVGVTSVMLIAFFRRNLRSAHNSLRALIAYRLCDLGVLGAAVWMHHTFPTSDFTHLRDDAVLPTSTLVAGALLFGSLAKSAQLPMSSWLHRAMEGPASSSAIFYGALSVHLGPILLLRTAPLWLPHEGIRVAMGLIGLSTAVYASLVGRARPDAKTSLAYATMAMLGVIFVELALGLHTLALVHVVAHAGLRTWQFLRSSSLIQDFQENPLVGADVMMGRRSQWENAFPEKWRRPLYLAALRQFWLDEAQWRFAARPVVALFEGVARVEAWLLGPFREEGEP
jgi:NADH:ubiquinone oxidoreductase subunit 5 (subunit L)/multisubunit Na+/H+ antiporter MnhA subunit